MSYDKNEFDMRTHGLNEPAMEKIYDKNMTNLSLCCKAPFIECSCGSMNFPCHRCECCGGDGTEKDKRECQGHIEDSTPVSCGEEQMKLVEACNSVREKAFDEAIAALQSVYSEAGNDGWYYGVERCVEKLKELRNK